MALLNKVFSRQAPGAIFMLLFGLFPVLIAGCAATATPKGNLAATEQNAIEEQWGISVEAIRQTANGHMIDFRYKVLDAEKAGTLFERNTKPYLIDQESGKVLTVPNTAKVGPLRSSNQPQEDRIYWMLFANPGVVKEGNKVTVVIGDFRAENLTVE